VDGGVKGDRDRPGGRGAASGALHRAAWRGLHRGQHAGERGVLGLALGEPDVVFGHGVPVPLLEVRSGPVDQGSGVGELAFQGLLVGLVGDEDRAGQAPLTELTSIFQQFIAGFRSLPLICPRDRIG